MTIERTSQRYIFVEYLFALSVAILLGRAIILLYVDGVLPQPFFYEPSDTFMDWFNTAYWAHDIGPYDSWGTIYPPLSFVVLKILGISSCYVSNEGLPARDCDWLGIVSIHVVFVLNALLIGLIYYKSDRRSALPRAFALAAGMPMLFALERGNILLLCFTCFILAFGPLVKSARLRWLFAGLAINFKVYLVAGVVAQLLKRRWLWVEGALLSVVLVYLASYGILGVGTPGEIYRNIATYSTGFAASQVLDIWYSVTYLPLISLLEGVNFPITGIVGSDLAETGLILSHGFVRVGQFFLIVAAIATWFRPNAVPLHRVTLIGVLFALISSEAGGYTQIMAIFLVFFERWEGIGRRVAITLCYIMCLPGDIVTGSFPPLQRFSYLAGRNVEVDIGVGIGMFIRPGLLIGVAVALSLVTIFSVSRAFRAPQETIPVTT